MSESQESPQERQVRTVLTDLIDGLRETFAAHQSGDIPPHRFLIQLQQQTDAAERSYHSIYPIITRQSQRDQQPQEAQNQDKGPVGRKPKGNVGQASQGREDKTGGGGRDAGPEA